MTKDEINFLMQNGFSISDIMQMQTNEQPGDNKPEEQPPEEKPAPPQEQKTEQPVNNNDAILAAISELTKAIHSTNIRAGGFPAPEGANSADTVMANIINPPGYATGENK